MVFSTTTTIKTPTDRERFLSGGKVFMPPVPEYLEEEQTEAQSGQIHNTKFFVSLMVKGE